MIKVKSFFTKLLHWEHWPSFMFYAPLLPYYLFTTLRAKNLFFHAAGNPGMKHAGNGTESKFDTLQLIPKKYKPLSFFVGSNDLFKDTADNIKKLDIKFPLIAKPDIGFRGYLVKKINTIEELKIYLQKNKVNTIIQEFIDYNNECGIIYHRIPGNDKGEITSITLKKFLTVTGDGTSNLSELIKNDNRAFLYYNLMRNIHQDKMLSVPNKNKVIHLSVIGNHSKGTQFINGNHLIDADLTAQFDLLSKQIKGWYFGRIDLKYNTFKELKQGRNFKILEINGVISEPTHIYDPTNASYFDALKSILKHWKILKVISKKNHTDFNIPYPKIRPYLKDLIWLKKYAKKIKTLNT